MPGDPVLDVTDGPGRDHPPYQGHPRMTLTYPVLDNAAEILFVVTGAEKVDALAKAATAGPGHSCRTRCAQRSIVVLADQAATGSNEDG